MKKVEQNLSEVSAEMLLHYLYPEMDDKWMVEHQGSFYRNYNSDLIAYDEETGEVQVARDSFMNLLPSGMLFPENSLRGKGLKGKISQLKERQRLLNDLFQPLDNISFKRRMGLEQEVAALLDSKFQYLLTNYFHYDLDAESNDYIKQIACLLPMVRYIKGDFMLIRNILSTLFGCEVTFKIGRYSETDQTRSWIAMATYEVLIEGLDTERYETMSKSVEELRLFMQEWFFPFDVHCVIAIKWHDQAMNETDNWLLDYNSELKQ